MEWVRAGGRGCGWGYGKEALWRERSREIWGQLGGGVLDSVSFARSVYVRTYAICIPEGISQGELDAEELTFGALI